MKAMTLTALLVFSQIVFGSDTSVVVIVRSALDTSKPLLSVTFDGKNLVIREKQQPAHNVPLIAQELSSLQKAVSAFTHKDWSGFWVQSSVLDGTVLVGRLVNGEKDSEFIGSNGCPPGFAEFAKAVDHALGRKVFGKGWKEMESAAEHFKTFEDETKEALRKADPEKD